MNDYLKFLYSYSKLYKPVHQYAMLERFTSLNALHDNVVQIFQPKDLASIFKMAEKNYTDSLKLGIESIDYYDPLYPESLKHIPKPPIVIFYLGNIEILSQNFFGIVGTRKPSRVSLLATSLLVDRIFKTPNLGIISGLANGIDKEAMTSALKLNIPCIGVLGTGLEKEYPPSNKDLYKEMKSKNNTLLISEMRVDEKVGVWSFPKRNRIITGISKALFLMEAPQKSGAVSSLGHALEQGKEIIVFDNESQMYNEGGRKAISDGATKITLQELSSKEQVFHISEISSSKNMYEESPMLFAKLSKMEEQGLISEIGGGYYKKNLSFRRIDD